MHKQLALGAALAALSFSSGAAATDATYNLSGSGISGSITLSYSPNPNTGPLGTSPNAYDPVGSYIITGVSGSFSDANIGLTNVPITGVVPSSPASPTSGNLLAPHSFGFYPVIGGLPNPQGVTVAGLSYDDLYYPGGSPQTATDYPFHGGVLDIYGVVFTLLGGDAVNLWSNGNMGQGVTYGAAVTNGTRQDNRTGLLDRQGGLMLTAGPEPATWTMLILGFCAIGVALRRRNARPAHA
jgi:hypothetical protein